MKNRRTFAAAALAALACSVVAGSTVAAQATHYHVVKRLVIGKATADYIIVDTLNRRLYGLGDKIVDVDSDKVIGTIAGGGGGYAIAPDQNRGMVRNGTMFDLTTLAVTGKLDVKADGSIYDPFTKRAFAWVDKDAWVVEMTNGKLLMKSTIGDGLESGVSDGRGKLFLNVETKGSIEKVDAATLKIEATWKIAGCGTAQGLSMDRETRRLFMACDKEMIVVNADDGGVIARMPVASRADQNAFDSGTKLAFNANRVDNTVTIVHEDSPSTFSVVQTVKTGGGARACAVDEKTHKLYIFYLESGQLVLEVLAP